jgi:hypothetical protein
MSAVQDTAVAITQGSLGSQGVCCISHVPGGDEFGSVEIAAASSCHAVRTTTGSDHEAHEGTTGRGVTMG